MVPPFATLLLFPDEIPDDLEQPYVPDDVVEPVADYKVALPLDTWVAFKVPGDSGDGPAMRPVLLQVAKDQVVGAVGVQGVEAGGEGRGQRDGERRHQKRQREAR